MGVSSLSSALWKSPKSPNESKVASSSVNEDENVKGSVSPAAAESENGPKASASCSSKESVHFQAHKKNNLTSSPLTWKGS